MNITSLCYILNNNSQVLLIYKKRGFGKDLWNGPGGKKEDNESLKESVVREVLEETGITINKLDPKGHIEFVWPKKPANDTKCFLYTVRDYYGQIQESDECLPQWFDLESIPYDQMWDDDRYWFPQLLDGNDVKKRIYFDESSKVDKIEEL